MQTAAAQAAAAAAAAAQAGAGAAASAAAAAMHLSCLLKPLFISREYSYPGPVLKKNFCYPPTNAGAAPRDEHRQTLQAVAFKRAHARIRTHLRV